MAHYDLVYGTEILSEHDIAREIYKRLNQKEYVPVSSAETDKGVSLDVEGRLPCDMGLYLIYRKDKFGQYECLYSGQGNIRNRIYRFEKERNDKSRSDECHSASKKIRQLEYLHHKEQIYVQFMSKHERDSVVLDVLYNHLKLKNIDEHIATFAKALFNKRIKKA